MKVAIVGAGLSGLSCAHELKRNGIVPTIFEKKGSTGELYDFQSILINNFNYPFHGNPFKYIKEKYHIDIKPQYSIKEIHTYAPNHRVYSLKGQLGYILKRGMYADSVENQIAQALSLPIHFNTEINIKDIIKDYDYIVVATGNYMDPQKFDIFTPTFQAQARIAKVLGDFKTDSVSTWWNMEYCNNGYAYIVPFTPKEARLVLVVNGINTTQELNDRWKLFLEKENIGYTINEIKDLNHEVGFVNPVQFGNLLFTGVAGGFLEDTFGFGAVKAMISGVTSARAILYNKDYNKMMKKFKNDIKKKHQLRVAENTLSNKNLSKTIALVHFPVIKHVVFNFPLFKVRQLSLPARIYNKLWRKHKGMRD